MPFEALVKEDKSQTIFLLKSSWYNSFVQNPEQKEFQYKPGEQVPIEIGEIVFPFSHPACRKENDGLVTEFRLGINYQGKNIKLRVATRIYSFETNGLQVTPFEPEKGYIISTEDFDIKKRRKKLLEAVKNAKGFGIYPECPSVLGVEINSDYFVQGGIAFFEDGPVVTPWMKHIEYRAGTPRLLGRLRCRAIINGMTFESKLVPTPQDLPTEISPETDDPRFTTGYDIYCGGIYTLDTGPLASDSLDTYSQEDDGRAIEVGPGHDLFFADNPEQIARTGIEFVIKGQ